MPIAANYHTHTARCGHARGTDREMVEAAIAAGLQIVGFSDHVPYPGVSPVVGRIRMPLSQTADYFASLSALRDEYAGQIELHIGFEAEYLPELFGGLQDFLQDFPCEYLILGQHYSAGDGWYYGRPTTDPAILHQYVGQVVAAIETGAFAYVAHPDLIHFQGDPAEERRAFLRLCSAARANGIPLEVNLLGLREGRQYPRSSLFAVAQEVGNELILGVDAHDPGDFAGALAEGRRWAEPLGLPIRDTLTKGEIRRWN